MTPKSPIWEARPIPADDVSIPWETRVLPTEEGYRVYSSRVTADDTEGYSCFVASGQIQIDPYTQTVTPPTRWEKLRGISLGEKLAQAVIRQEEVTDYRNKWRQR